MHIQICVEQVKELRLLLLQIEWGRKRIIEPKSLGARVLETEIGEGSIMGGNGREEL